MLKEILNDRIFFNLIKQCSIHFDPSSRIVDGDDEIDAQFDLVCSVDYNEFYNL